MLCAFESVIFFLFNGKGIIMMSLFFLLLLLLFFLLLLISLLILLSLIFILFLIPPMYIIFMIFLLLVLLIIFLCLLFLVLLCFYLGIASMCLLLSPLPDIFIFSALYVFNRHGFSTFDIFLLAWSDATIARRLIMSRFTYTDSRYIGYLPLL